MNAELSLPIAEKSRISLGYLRLSDSAPLIMAQELGLFSRYALDVELVREVSWANIRDKVIAGVLDGAQMLAPMPLAACLGASGMRSDMITGLSLSLNGNAITLSNTLSRELINRGARPEQSAASSAEALAGLVLENATGNHLTFATTYPYSCHSLQLNLWLGSAGITPNKDVRIIVLPPEQMVDNLARGTIDGFCVGEPWNSVAVQYGVGEIQATGYQVWNNAVEKVLGVSESWHKNFPATHLRMRLALMEACQWLADESNRVQAAEILSQPEYLNMPVGQLLPSLSGKLAFARDKTPVELPHFHVFGRFQAGFPWRSSARELLELTGNSLDKPYSLEQIKAVSQQAFRTDLYREAARYLDLPCPEGDYKPLNQHPDSWEIEPGIEVGPDMRL